MTISRQHLEILKEITDGKEVKTILPRDLLRPSKSFFGKAYLFSYENPVYKASLPYFMASPLVIILSRRGDNVLCCNLQHLSYLFSLQLASIIAKRIKNKKSRISYGIIKSAISRAQIPISLLYFSIRSYKITRIGGPVYEIPMEMYVECLKKLPRDSRKMTLRRAIQYNMQKYYTYMKKLKSKLGK